MNPVPVQFHLGPLTIHTYGIGLAVTFWFGFRYFERRLAKAGYPTDWVVGFFLWVVGAAVVGARTLHVLSMWGYYSHNPGDVLAIWHGGLSSFGGIIFAVPVGIVVARRGCPQLKTARALDMIAPVLMASWAMGRLLGPQLMTMGGGHPTHQWFGMYYNDQHGRRVPVPIFQSIEDFSIFCVLLLVERRLQRWPDGSSRADYPTGTVLGIGMILWGVERSLDQHLLLAEGGQLGSTLVQLAGIALVIGGIALLISTRRRWQRWLADGAPGGHPDPGSTLSVSATTPVQPEASDDDPGDDHRGDGHSGDSHSGDNVAGSEHVRADDPAGGP